MRVVMITNSLYPDKTGGLERYVRDLSEELIKRGHRVSVISKRTAEDQRDFEEYESGLVVRRYAVPSKQESFFALKYCPAVWSEVRKCLRAELDGSPDESTVVHGHFAVPCLPLLLSRRYPFVYTFHAPAYMELLGERQGTYRLPRVVQGLAVTGLRMLESWVVRHARTVVTLSAFMRDEAAKLSKGTLRRHVLIPGGIDVQRFKMSTTFSPRVGTTKLFCARRLVHRTGVDLLVESMRGVVAKNPRVQLSIAGDGPLRKELERRVDSLGLAEHVRFLGRISDSDLVKRYQTADLVVTPTRELEGFGLSTAESLACGTPCLVTPVGANAEVVAGLDKRYVATSADAQAIEDAICALLEAGPTLGRSRQEISEFAAKRFSWNVVCAQYERIYSEHLQERSGKSLMTKE